MKITFHFFYTLICTACNKKVDNIIPDGYGQEEAQFDVTNKVCPHCQKMGEMNVIKAETKSFS